MRKALGQSGGSSAKPACDETDRLDWRIRLPNGRQRLTDRAVTAVLADQELWRPLLHGPSNLSRCKCEVLPLGCSKEAPTNVGSEIPALSKPGCYPVSSLQSESSCSQPGSLGMPPCRLS